MSSTCKTLEKTRYGFPLALWNAAHDEITGILRDRARSGQTISYSELVAKITTVRLEPDALALHALLGDISEHENNRGRGMLSVLVVHKDGDMLPGGGFFTLAKKLGRDTTDRVECWVREFKRVTRPPHNRLLSTPRNST
jgi:hypothetical protein